MKMVCVGTEERVVGLHMTGPNAGEMMQGFAVALKYGSNREDVLLEEQLDSIVLGSFLEEVVQDCSRHLIELL